MNWYVIFQAKSPDSVVKHGKSSYFVTEFMMGTVTSTVTTRRGCKGRRNSCEMLQKHQADTQIWFRYFIVK